MTTYRRAPTVVVVACFLAISAGQSRSQQVEPTLEALKALRRDVTASAPAQGLIPAFNIHADKLLAEWEKKAPPEIQKEIAILRQTDAIERSDAADRLANVGSAANGANRALISMLGDDSLIMPGDIPRLFGAKLFSPSRRAAHALSAIGESAVPALILAACQDFKDVESDAPVYRKQLAIQTIETITGQNFGEDSESWIRWFTTTASPLIIGSGAEESRSRTERVGEVSIPFYKSNEFFWCLVVGAVIVFALRLRK
jgi:hypothetical protein